MKDWIRKLFFALITLAAIQQARAATVFPIATNVNPAAISGGTASSGSNYLVTVLSGTNVYVQLVSTNGTLNGSLVTLGITKNNNNPKDIQVAFGGTNYLVLWLNAFGNDWHGQIISLAGEKVGSALSYGSSVSLAQALLSDGTDFLAVWQDSSGPYYGLFLTSAEVLSGSVPGSVSSVFIITTNTINLAGAFGVGSYLFVWQQGPPFDTYGAFVSPSDNSGLVGTPFRISQTSSLDHNPPAIGFNGTNFFVLWNVDTARTTGGAPIWNLYGRLVSQSGAFAGGELLLNTNQPTFPSVAFDGANYLVAWSHDLNTTNSDEQLIFQFYDRSASPVGPEFTPFSSQGTNQPLFGGPLFDGHRYAAIATIGSVNVATNGTLGTFTDGAIYGTLLSPLPILAVSNYTGAQFSGTLMGTQGFTYAIQYATDAAASNWTGLVTNTNGTFSFTDPNATNKTRFYRAVAQ